LGSELCGEYWSAVTLFQGGGNVFQNEPYYYGYTGNRIHGIFSDWSTYTMRGDVSFHDFVSDTGLARGLGLYTHTELTWDEDATFSVSNFAAGAELGAVDTDNLDQPFAASEAKPVHIVWSYANLQFGDTFNTTMTNRPRTVSYSCIVGRDGIEEDSTFGEWTTDNSDCDDFASFTVLSEASLMRQSGRMHLQNDRSTLTLSLWLVAAIFTVFGLKELLRRTATSGKLLSADHEVTPLLQNEI